jgi:hypothetical protein
LKKAQVEEDAGMADYRAGYVPEAPRKRGPWLTIIIVLVVLCCLVVVCGGGYALWQFGDTILEWIMPYIGGLG